MTQTIDPNLDSVSKKQQSESLDLYLAFHEYSYDNRQVKEDFFFSNGVELPDQLDRAISKRRLDYLAGRYCAHLALAKLGHKLLNQIPSSSSRAPIWPEGFIGSITHTKDYAAALVGFKSHWFGLGLDAELVVDESKPALVQHVCRPNEFDQLGQNLSMSSEELFTLVFSAKESLFKALYPQIQKYFGFQAACVLDIDEPKSQFTIQLVENLDPNLAIMQKFEGIFRRVNNRILTLIQIPQISKI